MASWNDKDEGELLEECNICLVKVCKKRMTIHMVNCIEKNKKDFNTPEFAYLMRCPLYPNHVLPRAYLNHHLEYNCEEALNLLRKYFQRKDMQAQIKPMPANFMDHVPEKLLNHNNKFLLYILKRDIDGSNSADDKNIYPDEPREGESS